MELKNFKTLLDSRHWQRKQIIERDGPEGGWVCVNHTCTVSNIVIEYWNHYSVDGDDIEISECEIHAPINITKDFYVFDIDGDIIEDSFLCDHIGDDFKAIDKESAIEMVRKG